MRKCEDKLPNVIPKSNKIQLCIYDKTLSDFSSYSTYCVVYTLNILSGLLERLTVVVENIDLTYKHL